ncbi:uncharacterized protein VNE69_01242 [Vairimorpha necatrix]|uniref:Uncharacterized protein n=1 Tax=Vairimorpha necatrix TaxID=6039 RepID=A0AAX4J8L7_9MICR
MIEEEEKIVFYLEELDNNFSKINRTLKEIEDKISKIYKINTKVVSDYQPLMTMFENKSYDQEENQNTTIIMKSNSPKNPFTNDKSEIFDKSQVSEKDSSSTIEDPKIYSDSYVDESSNEEINEFDIEKIPDIFKDEEDFFELYNFILRSQRTKFEEIIDAFCNVDYDKICVYLDVLRNKKFIKKKGNVFYIE